MVISNHNTFRVLFDKTVSVYFVGEIYLYFSIGNGQPREPALSQLYRRTFVNSFPTAVHNQAQTPWERSPHSQKPVGRRHYFRPPPSRLMDLNAGQLTRRIYSRLMQWTNGAYEESWTTVALPTSHHFHPSSSHVVSLSSGILYEWTRTQTLAKPSSNLLQRTGGDHRGGRAQPG